MGAATTIAELAEALSTLGGGAAGGPSAPFDTLAATLKRVAGTHVRNAASVGGNAVLARCVVACIALQDMAGCLPSWYHTIQYGSAHVGRGCLCRPCLGSGCLRVFRVRAGRRV